MPDDDDRLSAALAAQAEAVAALEEAQAIAHVGSWVWDTGTGRITWSPELYRITGRPTDHVPTVESFDELVHPEDLPGLRRIRAKATATGIPFPHELRIIRGDGDVRWVSMRANTIEHDGTPTFLGVVHDVTERRALEQELQKRQVLEAVGRLASGVAHDFNNLLTIIVTNVELVMDRLGEPLTELEEVQRAADSATELTQRLLSIGRTSQAPPRPLELDSHLEQAVSLLRRVVGDGVEVRGCFAAGAWVVAEPRQLDRVLLNLVLNAKDAMPEGGVIRIATERTEPGWVVLTVEDTGVGMTAEVMARAAEPFYTTKGPSAGSGLGLAMVEGAMAQLGGKVTLDSEPGKGTRVGLAFPAAKEQPAEHPAAKPSPADLRGLTALVVEDEPSVRRATARLLRKHGLTVHEAEGPEAALPFVESELDVVVCDVSMPSGGGRRVLDTFLRARPDIPFVFMTGYTNRAEWLSDYLVVAKPFDPKRLTQAIEQVVAKAQLRAG